MRKISIRRITGNCVVFLCSVFLGSHFARAASPQNTLTFSANPKLLVLQKPAKDIDREKFERDWGQFEVAIDKNHFPFPAPNCKARIVIRMPGENPRHPRNAANLQWRWNMFQKFAGGAQTDGPEIEITLAPGPYMKKSRDGKFALQYCNAFFETPRD